MRLINNLVDKCVDLFGGLFFIALFNLVTFVWVGLGLADPHFFDPFPSNFYTLTVSWMAINFSSLILFAERRNKVREAKEHAKDQAKIEAILHLSESVQNILQYLVDKENHNDRTDA